MAGDLGPMLSSSLIGAWYGARAAQSLALTTPAAPRADAGQAQTSRQSGVLPPWDPRGEVVALDALRRTALASGSFFDSKLSDFTGLAVSEDEKKLFAMHQGVRKLQSLASAAAEKSVSAADRDFWNRRFQEGLSQLDSFFDGLDLEGVNVLRGEDLSKAESRLAISRGESRYVGGTIHQGAFDAEVDAFQGALSFEMTIRKSGVDTQVAIDLADMGSTPRTLDNVGAHINSALEGAGMLTRFERVKIGEKDSSGVIPGNDWGLAVRGILTERVSFSTSGGAPAVWTAGVSGQREGASSVSSQCSLIRFFS